MTERRHLDGSTEQPVRTVTMPHSNRVKPAPVLSEKRIAKLRSLAAAAGSSFSEDRANFLHRAGVPDSDVDDIASRTPAPPAMLDPEVARLNVLAAVAQARVA